MFDWCSGACRLASIAWCLGTAVRRGALLSRFTFPSFRWIVSLSLSACSTTCTRHLSGTDRHGATKCASELVFGLVFESSTVEHATGVEPVDGDSNQPNQFSARSIRAGEAQFSDFRARFDSGRCEAPQFYWIFRARGLNFRNEHDDGQCSFELTKG